MSVATVEHVSRAHLADAGDALKATIDAMPEQARDQFLRDLMRAVYLHSETGDESELERVVKGLLISTRLRDHDDYEGALKRAEDYDWQPGADVAEYLSKLHAARSRS